MSSTDGIAIECPRCREPRLASLEGEATVNTEAWLGVYRLFQCRDCQDVVLVVQEPVGFGGDLTRPHRLYPPRPGAPDVLPGDVRRAFQEAVRCHEQRINTATVIMCRRALEGLTMHLGATKKSRGLYKKLEQIEAADELPSEMLELAQHVRVIGNEQAHAIGQRVTESDAQEVLDFTRAVFEYAGFKKLVASLRAKADEEPDSTPQLEAR